MLASYQPVGHIIEAEFANPRLRIMGVAAMEKEWSLNELAVVIPILASGFAFAFVVGYFLAFDIAWFPFFSLSEHVVFALRVLPIAIGASVGLVIALRFSKIEKYWPRLQGKGYLFFRAWICVLLLAAALAGFSIHFGLASSFLLIAFGAFVHHRVHVSNKSSLANILYWTTTLLVLCLMFGFLSGLVLKFDTLRRFLNSVTRHSITGYSIAPSMIVDVKPDYGPKFYIGQVIFVGNSGVLFFDSEVRRIHLIRWRDIIDISECTNLEPVKCSPVTSTNAASP
jgi:hypothetical protein